MSGIPLSSVDPVVSENLIGGDRKALSDGLGCWPSRCVLGVGLKSVRKRVMPRDSISNVGG